MIFSEFPKQAIPESEKKPDWFKECVLGIASKYNTQSSNFKSRGARRPIDEIERYFAYYLGQQDNRDYYYTTQGVDNCNLNTVWINGQKIASLVDFMLGKGIELIENLQPEAKATSKVAVNKRTQALEEMLVKIQLKPMLDQLQEVSGISYKPQGLKGENVETEEDAQRYMDMDYKDFSEDVCMKLIEDIMNRNNMNMKYKQAFFYVLLGGLVGIKNKIVKGKQIKQVILPQNLIWDNNVDSDNNEDARFVGTIEYKTVGEILSNDNYTAQLSQEQYQELKRLEESDGDKELSTFGPSNLFQWVFRQNNIPMVGVIQGHWIGYKDMRRETTKDKYGNEHIARLRSDKKTSEFWKKTIYKGTLIGGKYIVDYGEETNIVRKITDKSDVQLPVSVFIPNMVMGENRASIVAKLHQHQDRVDYINNEITKTLNRNKGKQFIIHKSKLGTADATTILRDFERLGFHVSDGEDDGEGLADNKRLVETVDMTLDPNVQMLMMLRKEEERIMEEIVSLPKIATGQQSGYVGAKTQAGTIAQSNLGTAYLYQGFIGFVEYDLRFAANQYKLSLAAQPENADIPVLSNMGMKYVKATPEFIFEDFNVYIKIKDSIDEAARQRLIEAAFAALQNQAIDYLDYIEIETSSTFSQLKRTLTGALKRKKMEAQQQQQIMAMMEQAHQLERDAQQHSAQQGMEDTRQTGAAFREGLKSGAAPAAA